MISVICVSNRNSLYLYFNAQQMKKVLVLCDGEHFSESTFSFVSRLNELSPILLTGVFLPSVSYSDVMVYYLGGMTGPASAPAGEDVVESATIQANIKRFKSLCEKHHIEYRVHNDIKGDIIENLQKETRFADVAILNSDLFYSNYGSEGKDQYLADTMHFAECPVVLVPEHFHFPENIILAYDGSASSVYAIRQFAYTMPELTKLSTLLVYATADGSDIPDMDYISELTARHFRDLKFYTLDTDPKKYFNTWLSEQGNALVIAGAFGHSALSEIFRGNFMEDVINDNKLPLFITHK